MGKGICTNLRSLNLNARKGCKVLFESSSTAKARQAKCNLDCLVLWLLASCLGYNMHGIAWHAERHGRRSIRCVIVMVMNGNGRRWSCSCLVGTDRPTTISSHTGTGACHHLQHTYHYHYHRESPTTDNIILTFWWTWEGGERLGDNWHGDWRSIRWRGCPCSCRNPPTEHHRLQYYARFMVDGSSTSNALNVSCEHCVPIRDV